MVIGRSVLGRKIECYNARPSRGPVAPVRSLADTLVDHGRRVRALAARCRLSQARGSDQGTDQGSNRRGGACPVRDREAVISEGDHHELILGRPAYPGRPRLGGYSLGDQVANTMKLAANDVQTLVIPGCAHWVAEETPEETLTALTAFLAPYRDGTTAARSTSN